MRKSLVSAIKRLRIRNLKQKISLVGLGIGACGFALMLIPFFGEVLFNYKFFADDIPIKIGMLIAFAGLLLSSAFITKKPMFRSKKLENLCIFIEKYI